MDILQRSWQQSALLTASRRWLEVVTIVTFASIAAAEDMPSLLLSRLCSTCMVTLQPCVREDGKLNTNSQQYRSHRTRLPLEAHNVMLVPRTAS